MSDIKKSVDTKISRNKAPNGTFLKKMSHELIYGENKVIATRVKRNHSPTTCLKEKVLGIANPWCMP